MYTKVLCITTLYCSFAIVITSYLLSSLFHRLTIVYSVIFIIVQTLIVHT